ncbi:lysophospholipase [Vibrio astriarenae]|nr:lysophospholipase [Vibrio sp. C7]
MENNSKQLAMIKQIHIILISTLVLIGCHNTVVHPSFQSSNIEQNKVEHYHNSFEDYVQRTHSKLKSQRVFVSNDHQKEINANLPFQLQPEVTYPKEQTNKGILLIHGLGDSPWSFVDIGNSLAQKGFLVRTILLDGHGTRPADLISTDYETWLQQVDEQVNLLKPKVDEIYLGGFSTGANIAILNAIDNPDIAGLMLFSPGIKSSKSLVSLTPVISSLKTWLHSDLSSVSDNYTRYDEVPTNGFAQYYLTSKATMKALENKTFDRPTFMVLSEHDSVLDSKSILELFKASFIHEDSKLVWFGTNTSAEDERIVYIDSYKPSLKISNMSHMGVLFSPENPYYGINGEQKICDNGQRPSDEEHCLSNGEVWYSGYGYQEANKVHARLTYNPFYMEMINLLSSTFRL